MLKNGIAIIQRPKNYLLSGPHHCYFGITIDSVLYEISIDQMVIRTVTVTTESTVNLREMTTLFDNLDKLIMLGEGKFIPVEETRIVKENMFLKTNDRDSIFEDRLNLFESADFTRGECSTFLTFDKYLDTNLFVKWIDMLDELDILHNMFLYSLADTGIPIDFKCAYIIESFEALPELIKEYDTSYRLPQVCKGESKLKKYIISIINNFGKDIFPSEIEYGLEKVVQCFVNSRNRIAHIKSNQNKKYLDGCESVLYAKKLSFLYRNVLLHLLGVDYSLYSNAITESVSKLDKWENILDDFLAKLKN